MIKFASSATLLSARYSVFDKKSEEPDYDEDELEEEETKETRSFSKNDFNLNVKQCIPIASSGICSAKLFLVTKTLYTYTRTCSHCRRICFLYTFYLWPKFSVEFFMSDVTSSMKIVDLSCLVTCLCLQTMRRMELHMAYVYFSIPVEALRMSLFA
jgi:hypothetical protein